MIPQVGQKLFLAYDEPRDRGREHAVVVTAVGRKWVTIAPLGCEDASHIHEQFDMTNPRWPVDAGGFSSVARVWPSRDAWQREKERDRAYTALIRALEWKQLSPDVTGEDVRTAARALGVGAEFERHLETLKL